MPDTQAELRPVENEDFTFKNPPPHSPSPVYSIMHIQPFESEGIFAPGGPQRHMVVLGNFPFFGEQSECLGSV